MACDSHNNAREKLTHCQRVDVDDSLPVNEEHTSPAGPAGRVSLAELPVEILASVFLRFFERHKVPRQDQNWHLDTPLDIDSLYAAMLVCRRWRDVAILGFPELWQVLPPSMYHVRGRRSLLVEIMFAPCMRIRPYRLWGPEPPLYLKSPHGLDLPCVLAMLVHLSAPSPTRTTVVVYAVSTPQKATYSPTGHSPWQVPDFVFLELQPLVRPLR